MPAKSQNDLPVKGRNGRSGSQNNHSAATLAMVQCWFSPGCQHNTLACQHRFDLRLCDGEACSLATATAGDPPSAGTFRNPNQKILKKILRGPPCTASDLPAINSSVGLDQCQRKKSWKKFGVRWQKTARKSVSSDVHAHTPPRQVGA